MPGPFGPWGDAARRRRRARRGRREAIDDAVRRLLRLADRVGALGEPRGWPPTSGPTTPRRRDALQRWAVAGMTVLRNDGTLPLAAARPGRADRRAGRARPC